MSIYPALQALPGFSVITRWSQVIANYTAENAALTCEEGVAVDWDFVSIMLEPTHEQNQHPRRMTLLRFHKTPSATN